MQCLHCATAATEKQFQSKLCRHVSATGMDGKYYKATIPPELQNNANDWGDPLQDCDEI